MAERGHVSLLLEAMATVVDEMDIDYGACCPSRIQSMGKGWDTYDSAEDVFGVDRPDPALAGEFPSHFKKELQRPALEHSDRLGG